jgi:hypothetical protein
MKFTRAKAQNIIFVASELSIFGALVHGGKPSG